MGSVSGDPYAVWYRRAIDAGLARASGNSRPTDTGVRRVDPGGLADADAAANVEAVADEHADAGLRGGDCQERDALHGAQRGADRSGGDSDPALP